MAERVIHGFAFLRDAPPALLRMKVREFISGIPPPCRRRMR